ncbi:SDR family NAD(P)-dependent oxidoreductase [Aporhodopirellula aestuarii]|uniref:SDR family NAD(P)-dependent oxidoreductase n=1 Tax=Aporhodopirellula aestuarii TaxID=2950107 RepID=A0ABT0TXE9_9BACT|nr:SDR family NAD(P)-dependent oxidoreductase [Aporhodopirellula aestuarii]MCM2369146.1 SDR family NAD(P)-dependent oxidoreductase [Aporhodopirellula aestuarii]
MATPTKPEKKPWNQRRSRWRPEGSLAIVTGASSGIGRELTFLLVSKGCRVIAVARRKERLDELVSQTRQNASNAAVIPVVGDVTDMSVREEALELVDQLADGKLNLLVNNAGVGGIGRFMDADPDRMRQIMEVNFHAPVQWTRGAMPMLRRAAADTAVTHCTPVICNIGSVLGHRAVPDKSEYCASKFALHGWSDSLRAELVSEGIAVVLVSPSTTRSEFFESLVGTEPGQKSNSVGSWPASRVARATLAAIVACRAEVILSLGGKALVYSDRLTPPLVNAVLARTAGKPK